MPKTESYARIAITLPANDLAAADRLAASQDRSRSWIVAEAIRRYAAEMEAPAPANALGASWLAQLRRDVGLTPEARVLEGEEIAEVGPAPGPIVAPRTEDARYVIVGATAMQLWGTSRTTRYVG